MVEQLKPFPPHIPSTVTPRCSMELTTASNHERQWRIHRGQQEPFICSRPSVVKIGEKHYCRLHGGHVALDMLLAGKLKET